MDLKLSKSHLVQVNSCSHDDTLILWPMSSKKKKQKFSVGDDNGTVSCWEMKKSVEPVEQFSYQTQSREPIRAMSLNQNMSKRDRLFAAQGQSVFGVSKKGKEVFRLVSPSTEPINHMAVDELMIYTGCEYVCQIYDNAKDAGFLMCQDRIHALTVMPLSPRAHAADAVLGCADRRLRVVRPRSSGGAGLAYEVKLGTPVSCLTPYYGNLGVKPPPRRPPPGGSDGYDGTAAAEGKEEGGEGKEGGAASPLNAKGDGGPGDVEGLMPAMEEMQLGPKGHKVAYGTATGVLGMVEMLEDHSQRVFETNPADTKHREGAALISAHDLTKDGVADLIVARNDGKIEVLSFDLAGGSDPQVQFEANVNESVHGMKCGVVSSPDYEELVVLTYSGRVMSFTTEPVDRRDETDLRGKTVKQNRAESTLKTLKAELDELEAKVDKERERFTGGGGGGGRGGGRLSAATQLFQRGSGGRDEAPSAGGGAASAQQQQQQQQQQANQASNNSSNSNSSNFLPTAQQFHVKTRMELVPDEAAYVLSLEIPLPLDMVTLTSTVRLDLLDTDGSQAIVGVSPADPGNGKAVLATYRFQDNVSRAEIRYRTAEGESGEIMLGVVAKLEPKMSQITKVTIKPLSLHHRVHELQSLVDARAAEEAAKSRFGDLTDVDPSAPATVQQQQLLERQAGLEALDDANWNVLEITGKFTMSMMHDWVGTALPEVPPRAQDAERTLYFVNVFTETELSVEYKKGHALVKADSISTIAILRDVVSKKARDLRVDVNMDKCVLSEAALKRTLKKLDPKLHHQLALAKSIELLDAVKEVSLQDQNSSTWMAPTLQTMLDNEAKLRSEYKDRTRALAFIVGIICDLFVDWYKLQLGGQDVRHKISELEAFLTTQYSYQGLCEMWFQLESS